MTKIEAELRFLRMSQSLLSDADWLDSIAWIRRASAAQEKRRLLDDTE